MRLQQLRERQACNNECAAALAAKPVIVRPICCRHRCRLGNAHAGSRTRVTSMGGLYDAATLRARNDALKQQKMSMWTYCGCEEKSKARSVDAAFVLRVLAHPSQGAFRSRASRQRFGCSKGWEVLIAIGYAAGDGVVVVAVGNASGRCATQRCNR